MIKRTSYIISFPGVYSKLLSSIAMLFIIAFLLTVFSSGVVTDPICEVPPTVVGEQKVTIYGRKESSKWVTTILSQFDSEGSPESPNLEFGQKVLKCNGREVVQITAVLREKGDLRDISASLATALPDDILRFHSSGAKNVRVTNNGMTVSRINEEEVGNAGILTNRPLKDDELFQVRLDRCLTKFSSNGIGITNHSPSTIRYGSWFSSEATTLYDNTLYGNHGGTYGSNLATLKAGDIVGVKKKKNGDLHFFVNGADQGIAASGIASPVYGVYDLYGKCVQATIVTN